MRKLTIISMLCASLMLCGYSTTGSSHVELEITDSYDNEYSSYNTIELNGQKITLPCKVSLFKKVGFKPDKEYTINKQSIMSGVSFYDKNGNELYLDVINNKEYVDSDIMNCDVYKVTYDYKPDGVNEINLRLENVDCGDSESSVNNVLGDELYKSDSYEGIYTKYFSSPKNERKIMLSFENGKVISITAEVDTPLNYNYQSWFGYENELYKSETNTQSSQTSTTYYDDDYEDELRDIPDPGLYDHKNRVKVQTTEGLNFVKSIFAFVIGMILVIGALVLSIFIVVARKQKRHDRLREMEEARRILNTDIDDIADEINNGGR